MTRRLLVFAWLLPSLLALAGCKKPQPVMVSASMQDKLTEIGRMYTAYTQDHKQPPKTLSDLDKPVYEVANTEGFAALRDGECVMLWGGRLPGAGAGATVLAYEASVPENGGLVLFQDGTVKSLTAEEFKAAPKVK